MGDGDVEVRAAGGLVHRVRSGEPDGVLEVLLVHRPKYDDWTFPKGKLDPGETFEDAAVREVEEEAGLSCTLGAELPSRH
jgi:8-oxo-dGTP diphosphatase